MGREKRCEQIRRELSVRATIEEGAEEERMDETTRLHMESCPDCSAFLSKLERLEAQVMVWQTSPPPSLESRISAVLAAERTSGRRESAGGYSRLFASLNRLRENRHMVKRVSWAGAVSIGLLILVAGQQMGHANTLLKRMGQATQRIKSVHLIGWNCELNADVTQEVINGNSQISAGRVLPHRFEAWITEGRWRESQDFDVTVYASGKVWRNGVLVPGEKRPPLLTSFATRAIMGEEPFGTGVEFISETLGDVVLNGQTATKLLLESKKKRGADGVEPIQERRFLWLDPNTALPIRMEQMRYNIDRWELDDVVWFDYDQPVADTMFDTLKIRKEQHGRVNYDLPSAKALYRFTDSQYARYTAILQAQSSDQKRINLLPGLTHEQKNDLLVKSGAQEQSRLRQMMTPDQQKLFDDWWYVQPKILDKLLTPKQRREDAKWHVEQQALMDDWFNSQTEETQKRVGNSLFGNKTNGQ